MAEHRDAMVAMIRLSQIRCTSPPAGSPRTNASTIDHGGQPRSPNFLSREEVVTSLKKSFDKIQRTKVSELQSSSGSVVSLPQLCSVIAQVPLHPQNRQRRKFKSPSRLSPVQFIPRSVTPARRKYKINHSVSTIPTSQSAINDSAPPICTVDTQPSSTSPHRSPYEPPQQHQKQKHLEHERILRKAGYVNENDFDNDDERQLAVNQAKKIAHRRALLRSLHHHRPATVDIVESVGSLCTVNRFDSPINSGRQGTAQPSPHCCASTLQQMSHSTTSDDIFGSAIGSHLMSRARREGHMLRQGVLASIPVPSSELVMRTVPMLDGVDSLSLTAKGGNCFRLSSDLQFSLKNSFIK
jgi:hypothetical protein